MRQAAHPTLRQARCSAPVFRLSDTNSGRWKGPLLSDEGKHAPRRPPLRRRSAPKHGPLSNRPWHPTTSLAKARKVPVETLRRGWPRIARGSCLLTMNSLTPMRGLELEIGHAGQHHELAEIHANVVRHAVLPIPHADLVFRLKCTRRAIEERNMHSSARELTQ